MNIFTPRVDDLYDLFPLRYSSLSRSARKGRSIPDLYDLAHVARWHPCSRHDPAHVYGLDLYYADPEQPLTTAGEDIDDLDRDLSDLSGLDHLSICPRC